MVFQKALETAIHVFETKGYTPNDVLTVDAIQTDTYKQMMSPMTPYKSKKEGYHLRRSG